jgi:hypothetical protein
MRGELNFIVIFFFYGLAFFSMGLLVMLEGGRASDPGLRKALRPLAAFGLLHGAHEWVEMYEIIAVSFGADGIFIRRKGHGNDLADVLRLPK